MKQEGASERNCNLERGTRNYTSSPEGSQAVPVLPSVGTMLIIELI
jgi:hypothetical protein